MSVLEMCFVLYVHSEYVPVIMMIMMCVLKNSDFLKHHKICFLFLKPRNTIAVILTFYCYSLWLSDA